MAMIEEILFILHVDNGSYIIIHNVDIKKYNYMNSNTTKKVFLSIHILVSIPQYKYKHNYIEYLKILINAV